MRGKAATSDMQRDRALRYPGRWLELRYLSLADDTASVAPYDDVQDRKITRR